MRLRILLSALAILASTGCDDRQAGTEVGNPEVMDKVTTAFGTYDYTGNVPMASLYFRVIRMDYDFTRPGSALESGTCWNQPAGTLVDWTGEDTARHLPDTTIRSGTWIRSEMVLRTAEGPDTLPDSADIRMWSSPRYAKFYLVQNKDSLPALFQMPQGMEIRLMYGANRMADWRWADLIWVTIFFDVDTWAKPLGLRGAWTTRRDGKRARYVVFSPTENAEAWTGLKQRLPENFRADSVTVR